ncbi:MAG: hypothetical protein RR473_08985, partial [Comamonas sp.]
ADQGEKYGYFHGQAPAVSKRLSGRLNCCTDLYCRKTATGSAPKMQAQLKEIARLAAGYRLFSLQAARLASRKTSGLATFLITNQIYMKDETIVCFHIELVYSSA